MNQMVPYLRKVFLFNALPDEQLESFSRFCSLHEYIKEQHVFHEGQYAEAFYCVIRGKFKIYRVSSDGIEHILEIQEPNDLIAEAALFDRETYPASCRSLEDSTLLRIPRREFISLLLSHEKVTLAILHAYSWRLREFVNLVGVLSMYDVKSRLARYLLKKSLPEKGRLEFRMITSKKELASVLGTIPETLSRTLHFFKKQDVLVEEGKTITIIDPEKLATFL